MIHLLYIFEITFISCFKLVEMCQENVVLKDLDKSGNDLKLLIIGKSSFSEILQDSCSVGNSNILSLKETDGKLNVNYYLDEVNMFFSEFLLKYCVMKESGPESNRLGTSLTISRTNKRKVFNFLHQKLIINSEDIKFFFCKFSENISGRTIQKFRLEPIIYYAVENLNKTENTIQPLHEFIDDFDKNPKNHKIKIEDYDRDRFNIYLSSLITFIKQYDFLLDKLRCNEIKIMKTLWKSCLKRNQEYTIKITLSDRRVYEFQKNASDRGDIILTRKDFDNLFTEKKVFDKVLISMKSGRRMIEYNVTEKVESL